MTKEEILDGIAKTDAVINNSSIPEAVKQVAINKKAELQSKLDAMGGEAPKVEKEEVIEKEVEKEVVAPKKERIKFERKPRTPKAPKKEKEAETESPESKAEKSMEGKTLSVANCRELLAKLKTRREGAKKRVATRKKQGKPAQLTTIEVLKKASDNLEKKVETEVNKDGKLQKNTITRSTKEVVDIVATIISGIPTKAERTSYINEVIADLKKLIDKVEPITEKMEKGGYMAKGGITKDSIKRTLTSDTSQYFLEKDGDGYILTITPRGAMNSNFYYKFNVQSLPNDYTALKYRLSPLGYAKGGYMADGGMTKDFSGNYYSTNDFVGSNGLKALANEVFGKGWESEDDVDQIAELANHSGLKYVVIYAENRSEWNKYRGIDTAHPTNDSNYDIFVIANEDWKKYVNDSEGDSDLEDEEEYAKGGYMADGGAIENQYEGRTPKDIWESWNQEQKIHFFIDHKKHPYYNMGREEFVVSKNDREKYVGMSYDDLPKMVKLMISEHIVEGQYAKGGNVNYRKNWEVTYITFQGKKGKKVITLGRMSDEGDVKNQLKRMDLNIQEVTSIKEIGMMAKGGIVSKRERVIDYYFNNDVFDDPDAYDLEEGDLKDYKKVEEAIVKYHGLDNDGNVQERFETLGLEEFAHGGKITRNKNKNDYNSMFNFFIENNYQPIGKRDLINMAYESSNGIDSAIPQSMVGDVDNTAYYVYDYQTDKMGELVDLRMKLKFSDVKVDVTIVQDGELKYRDELPSELQNATFHQALNYVFMNDDVEQFAIRPKK